MKRREDRERERERERERGGEEYNVFIRIQVKMVHACEPKKGGIERQAMSSACGDIG